MTTPHIRDKDAAGAALLMAELALEQKRRGQTVVDYLDRLYREFGYHRNEGASVFMRGLEGRQQMTRMLEGLRATPPRRLAGLAVTEFEDLRDEQGRFGPLKGATDAASRNVLIFRCGERVRGAAAERHRTEGQDVSGSLLAASAGLCFRRGLAAYLPGRGRIDGAIGRRFQAAGVATYRTRSVRSRLAGVRASKP